MRCLLGKHPGGCAAMSPFRVCVALVFCVQHTMLAGHASLAASVLLRVRAPPDCKPGVHAQISLALCLARRMRSCWRPRAASSGAWASAAWAGPSAGPRARSRSCSRWGQILKSFQPLTKIPEGVNQPLQEKQYFLTWRCIYKWHR